VEPGLISSFIGGIGLFLLGMRLMSDGLKMAAGDALRHILSRWTRTPLRGFFSGILITSLVQSSSAVTVAVIGFVNAGLLSLLQTVYVIYGTNIGTTMTSWLVALVGFKLNIQSVALPLIGLGMFMRLIDVNGRRGAIGESLAGFGLFFLGIAILKQAFGDVGDTINLAEYAADGGGLLLFTALGFMLTFLMQSSSAAMAVTLTAAASGVIPLYAAAATVIGANVGTTTTAAFSVIGATPNAQRTAAAHVIFNILTALVAMLLLQPLLDLVQLLLQLFTPDAGVATKLALFHTLFNILGVALLWFLTPALVHWLEGRLHSAEEDLGRPLYLDRNVVATPVLALNALVMELARMGALASNMLQDLFSSERSVSTQLHRDKTVMARLEQAVDEFSVTMQRAPLPADIGDHLPLALRTTRYYKEVANMAVIMAGLQEGLAYIEEPRLVESMGRFRSECVNLLAKLDPLSEAYSSLDIVQAMSELENYYEQLKAQLLRAGATGQLKFSVMVAQLDLYRDLRRAMEQAVKGADALHELAALASRYLQTTEQIEGARAEEIRAEETKTEEIKTEEIKTEEIKTEEIKTEEIKTEEIKTEEIKPSND
jgi:phosphate:Na+ symporter